MGVKLGVETRKKSIVYVLLTTGEVSPALTTMALTTTVVPSPVTGIGEEYTGDCFVGSGVEAAVGPVVKWMAAPETWVAIVTFVSFE
jgi:hypothetical protein